MRWTGEGSWSGDVELTVGKTEYKARVRAEAAWWHTTGDWNEPPDGETKVTECKAEWFLDGERVEETPEMYDELIYYLENEDLNWKEC